MRDVTRTISEFEKIYTENIKREGGEKLFDYLKKSDFFSAPASSRFHGAFDGGLVTHSVNVYNCLKAYLERDRVRDLYAVSYPDESIAITALLHDICKIDVYKKDFRNVKNDAGVWERVPCYKFDDSLPYGHGEKSVYMISGFMRLSRDEAMAIRWHMGFSGIEDNVMTGNALSKYPLAFALCTADMEASYFLEKE